MSPKSGRPRASDLAARGIDTRQNILDAFARLVAEQGYEATSYAAVAAAVGVTKGTVVHHFPSKEQMLQEGHQQYIQRRIDEMYRILANVSDPALQLTAMIYCIVRAHRDDRAGTVAFLREFALFASTELNPQVRELRAEYTNIMTGIVRRGVAQERLMVDDPVLTSMQIFGMVNHVWTWYRPHESASAELIAAEFASNILNGLTHVSETHELSTVGLLDFIQSIEPYMAPIQTNAPTRLVSAGKQTHANSQSSGQVQALTS